MAGDRGATPLNAAFLATKPLQILVCLMLARQLGLSGTADLFVVDNFAGAGAVIDELANGSFGWRSVRKCGSRFEALDLASRQSRKVFLDRDVGLAMYVAMLRQKAVRGTQFAIYEEGVSSYDAFSELSRRQQLVLKLVGGATMLGRSRLTSELWLFEPGEVALGLRQEFKLRRIEGELQRFIRDERESLSLLFWRGSPLGHPSEPECHLYLPSWTPDTRTATAVVERQGDSFLKLHPHTREGHPVSELGFKQVLPSVIPAELLLAELCDLYRVVHVYHHGSSVTRYYRSAQVQFHLIEEAA